MSYEAFVYSITAPLQKRSESGQRLQGREGNRGAFVADRQLDQELADRRDTDRSMGIATGALALGGGVLGSVASLAARRPSMNKFLVGGGLGLGAAGLPFYAASRIHYNNSPERRQAD